MLLALDKERPCWIAKTDVFIFWIDWFDRSVTNERHEMPIYVFHFDDVCVYDCDWKSRIHHSEVLTCTLSTYASNYFWLLTHPAASSQQPSSTQQLDRWARLHRVACYTWVFHLLDHTPPTSTCNNYSIARIRRCTQQCHDVCGHCRTQFCHDSRNWNSLHSSARVHPSISI